MEFLDGSGKDIFVICNDTSIHEPHNLRLGASLTVVVCVGRKPRHYGGVAWWENEDIGWSHLSGAVRKRYDYDGYPPRHKKVPFSLVSCIR